MWRSLKVAFVVALFLALALAGCTGTTPEPECTHTTRVLGPASMAIRALHPPLSVSEETERNDTVGAQNLWLDDRPLDLIELDFGRSNPDLGITVESGIMTFDIDDEGVLVFRDGQPVSLPLEFDEGTHSGFTLTITLAPEEGPTDPRPLDLLWDYQRENPEHTAARLYDVGLWYRSCTAA